MSEEFPRSIQEKLSQEGKTQEEREADWQQELVQVGRKFGGVEFKSVKPKIKTKVEFLPAELDWNLFTEDISKEEKEKLSLMFSELIEYLDSSIITDDFADHNQRSAWEKEYLNLLSPEAQEYYKHNRLGLNFNSRLNKFCRFLVISQEDKNDTLDQNKFEQLQFFLELIPKELNNGDLYAQLTTEEKIERINKLDSLASTVIRLLGRQPIEQSN